MAEPISTAVATKSLYVSFGFLTAAVANAFQEVKKSGYKGFGMFMGNVLVAVVAGEIMYSFLSVYKPEYALSVGFASAYIGPNSVNVLWEVIKKTISQK
jgi:hypothetical protein